MRRTISALFMTVVLAFGLVPAAVADDGVGQEPRAEHVPHACQGYVDELNAEQATSANLRAHMAILNETIAELEHWYGAVLESRDRLEKVTERQAAQIKRQHAYIERLRAALRNR